MSDAADRFEERIWRLRERADRDVAAFEPPADPPADDRAMGYLREGVGPAVALYVEARTGGLLVRFTPEQFEALESAMNDWLELYAACYGRDVTASFTVREAAQLLVDTENVRDVAQLLTAVPER